MSTLRICVHMILSRDLLVTCGHQSPNTGRSGQSQWTLNTEAVSACVPRHSLLLFLPIKLNPMNLCLFDISNILQILAG
jgi:hypothetical protein